MTFIVEVNIIQNIVDIAFSVSELRNIKEFDQFRSMCGNIAVRAYLLR